MKCPCCGGAELVRDTRDQTSVYKGDVITIPAVTADYCRVCGEGVLDRENGDGYAAALKAARMKLAKAHK